MRGFWLSSGFISENSDSFFRLSFSFWYPLSSDVQSELLSYFITNRITAMSDFRVTLEAAWIVRDVASAADAVGIAVSECGKRLHPSAKFVDVDVLNSPCPHCGREITTATVAARTALVGLLLSMRVFDANSPEHAEKIALRVIGSALRDVPLSLFEIEEADGDEKGAGSGRNVSRPEDTA